MVLQQVFQTLLDLQTSAQRIRRQLVRLVPGLDNAAIGRILDETDRLETLFAQNVASALGYTPMAMGGLVTSPTLALIGEAGPEMVVPIRKKKRKVSKYQRELGKQLKLLENQKRLKNGKYRSGWDRSRIMKKAHKLTRSKLNMR